MSVCLFDPQKYRYLLTYLLTVSTMTTKI